MTTTPTTDDVLPREQQRNVVASQIAQWKRDRYGLETNYRVHKKIGAPKEALDQLATQLVQAEQAIDELQVILQELA